MTAEKKDNVEQAILEAAEQEFIEKGYDGAKTADIARRAGVTHAMLHYYYRTKENIFEVFIDRKMEEVMAIVGMSFGDDGSMPFIERIQRVINLHFDFLMQHPDMPRFILNEIVTKPARLRELKKRIADSLEGSLPMSIAIELEKAVERGEVRPIGAVDMFFDIVSLNIAAFVAVPAVREIMGAEISEREFLEARRRENIEMIKRRLTI